MKENMTFSEEFIYEFIGQVLEGNGRGIYNNNSSNDGGIIVDSANDIKFSTDRIADGCFEGHFWHSEVGASKIVFIFDDFDEVIKIPFCGYYEPEYDDNGEEIEGNYEYYEFINHIEEEISIYRDCDSSVKKILLEDEYVCCYDRVPIYIQKKIKVTECCADNRIKDYSENTISTVKQIKKNSQKNRAEAYYMSDKWLASVVEFYPDEYEEIIEGIDFQDLHSSNYGYMADGSPIIFDYAGYCSELY